MTAYVPNRCANSGMSSYPTSTGKTVVLLDTGNYPSYSSFGNATLTFPGSGTPNWTDTSATFVNANGPLPGRTDMVLCYDGTDVMMYGGRGSSSTAGVLEDTFLWNGTSWTVANPANVPFGRYKAQAAYLPGTGTVMFGGENVNGMQLQTWIWVNSTKNWTLVPEANGASPAARTGHCMASNGSVVVLFGGRTPKSQLNDTWTFNGSAWTQIHPANTPSIRSEASMCYDSVNNVFVLFGGQNEYNFTNDTYVLNSGATQWTHVPVANGSGPSGLINAQMAWDSTTSRSILFGGISATTNYPSNSTYSFNASNMVWTKL